MGTCVSLAGAATSIIFVATKHVFCRQSRDKIMFVATNTCRDKHVFVATKMILVAAPVNDTCRHQSSCGQTKSPCGLVWEPPSPEGSKFGAAPPKDRTPWPLVLILKMPGRAQQGYELGYKDIYSPVTLKCAQKFVWVMFHSYSSLANRYEIAISHV